MLDRVLLAALLAAPARAVVLGLAPLSPVAEVRLAPAPALAASVLPAAALAPLVPPTLYFIAGAPTLAPLTAATAAAVRAAAAPAATPAPFMAPPASPRAVPPRRRAETVQEVSARMRTDAERVGRAFKSLEWRDGVNFGGMGNRNPQRIYRAEPGPRGRAVLVQPDAVRRIPEGEMLPYVLTADGSIDVGWPAKDVERGVKHLQLADSRDVVFAGEIGRRRGRLIIDLNSGTFSSYGLDDRWAYTPQNIALLEDYASALLGERVEVVSHLNQN